MEIVSDQKRGQVRRDDNSGKTGGEDPARYAAKFSWPIPDDRRHNADVQDKPDAADDRLRPGKRVNECEDEFPRDVAAGGHYRHTVASVRESATDYQNVAGAPAYSNTNAQDCFHPSGSTPCRSSQILRRKRLRMLLSECWC